MLLFRTTLHRFGKACVVLALLVSAACITSPPVQEMSDARQALSVAKTAGAHEAVPDIYAEAEDLLDSAEQYLEKRSFALARRDAVAAKNKAVAARKAATRLTRPQEPPEAGDEGSTPDL